MTEIYGNLSMEADSQPAMTVPYPWRRYWARSLDMGLYGLIWTYILIMALRFKEQGGFLQSMVGVVVALALSLLIEPVMISFLGTTPGKWIFGLSISRTDGERLSYQEALQRTWGVIRSGMGYGIPFYTLYRNYKCYELCRDGRQNEWELDLGYQIKDTSGIRFLGIFLGMAAIIAVSVLLSFYGQLPIHRGSLTEEQFYENVNDMMKYHGLEKGYVLSNDGRWVEKESEAHIITFTGTKLPTYELTLTDGHVVGVTMMLEITDGSWVDDVSGDALMAYLAFVGAKRGTNPFDLLERGVLLTMSPGFSDYTFIKNNVEIRNTVAYRGYDEGPKILFSEEGEDSYFRMVFSMRQLDE